MALLAFLAKDARLLARNRPLLAALLAYPFLLAIVLGAAFQEPPATLDLAVVDLDATGGTIDVGGTPIGVDELLDSTSDFARVQRFATEEDAFRVLRAGDVDAVLIVPPGFIEALSRLGTNTTLRLVVDESDPVRAGVAKNAIEGAVESFIERIVQKKIDDVVALLDLTVEGGPFLTENILGIDNAIDRLTQVRDSLPNGSNEGARVQSVIDFLVFARGFLGDSERFLSTTAIPIDVQDEGLTTKKASLASVALPGALVLGVFWTGSLAAALLAARERETGADRRIAAAPHARYAPILSKTLVALVAALLPAALVLVLGIVALGATVADPGLTIVALALAALAAAALGGLAAAIARGTGAAALLAVLALVPMLLLGGLFYPIAYMPALARAIASVLPVTLATEALRGAMLRGSSAIELALPLAGLAIVAVVLALAIALLARRAR